MDAATHAQPQKHALKEVVMSEKKGLRIFRLGGVAQKVVKYAPCSFLVAR